MSAVPSLAASVDVLARRTLEARLAEKLSLHLFDALGALIAGVQVADAKAIAALTLGSGSAPERDTLPWLDPTCAAAAIRCTEIDDIHIAACVTPSAAVVPALLDLVSPDAGLTGDHLLRAYLAGFEVMIRFASAAGGPRLMARGIWPSRLAAPLGAAAATSVGLSLDADKTAHALAMAAAMAGGLSPRGGIPSSRWLIFGRAAADGIAAARAAASGLKGDPSVLDGAWGKATEVDLDAGVLSPAGEDELAVDGLSLKPWCAARQTMAAIEGFRRICRDHNLDASALKDVLVEVPAAYAAMIDHDALPKTRPATFANLRYLLGLAAFAPEALTDIRRDDLRIDLRFEALAEVVRIQPTEDFDALYPARWPARVTVTTAQGGTHCAEITDVPGDAPTTLGWDDVERKICAAAGLPGDALIPLSDACRALPAASGGEELIAAVSSLCANVKTRVENVGS